MKPRINLEPNNTIVFIGDSITDAGRREPAYSPLGYGYVHFAANQLFAKHPELNLNIINTGISGNTIRDLDARWKTDCLDLKPDILSILIGINDVWRQHGGMLDEAVLLNEYKSTYERLLSQTKEKYNCRLVLMEPFMFCDNTHDPMFNALKEYIKTVNELAKKFDAVLVPLQQAINNKIKQVPPHRWSDDMVHPYLWAHAWIAQRWLEATNL